MSDIIIISGSTGGSGSSMTGSINSGSSMTGSIDEILCILATEIREMRDQVKALWLREAVQETQLSAEVMQPIIEERFKRAKRMRRPLLEGEIRHALSKSDGTMIGAARYLEVHIGTFKRYCRLYDSNNCGALPLLWSPTRGTQVRKIKRERGFMYKR